MPKPLLLIFLLTLSIQPLNAQSLDRQVSEVLKLKLTPDEVADSALQCVLLYHDDSPMEQYRACERVMTDQIMPYALSHTINDSIMGFLYDEWAMSKMRQGPDAQEEFVPLFKKGIDHAVAAADHFRHGRLLEHLGFHEIKYGDLAAGFDYTRQALEAYHKSLNDADMQITRCYYMQAVIYMQLDDKAGLQSVIDQMSAATDAIRPENRLFHLYNLYSIEEAAYASMWHEEKNPQKKKDYADRSNLASLKAIQLIESAPEGWLNTSISPAWNYHNRASMFTNRFDRPPMDSVLYYADKAVNRNFKNEMEAIEVAISTAQTVAEAWLKNGNYPKAKALLEETEEKLRTKSGENNLIQDRIMLYEVLKQMAEAAGNYGHALAYADSIRVTEKERYSLERTAAVKDLEVKYKTQETELALSQSEARRSSTLMWLFAVGFALLAAVIAFVVYADRQRRRRMRREIEFANLRVDLGRELAREYVNGLEFERGRMSRELHDGVCNDLLAIQMNISGGQSTDQINAQIDTCREVVRRISHQLMPPEFTYANLDEVVRFFIAKQSSADAAIVFKYSSRTDSDWAAVPDAVALEIYRIVQETVGNAVKHSGCSRIVVDMVLEGNCIKVDVADDGRFKAADRKGIGLESIRKRINSLNGDIQMHSDPDLGTSITFTVII